MKRRSPWLALMAGIGLALALSSSALAYVEQVPTTITVTPFRGTVPCGHPYSVVATVLDQDGKPIKHLTVNFVITSSPSTQDKLMPTSAKTNKHGQAKVFIKYACTIGNRVITATAGDISASAVVYVKLRSRHHDHDGDDDHDRDGVNLSAGAPAVLTIAADSLPNTSTLPIDTTNDSSPALAIVTLLALMAAATIIVRRLSLTRR